MGADAVGAAPGARRTLEAEQAGMEQTLQELGGAQSATGLAWAWQTRVRPLWRTEPRLYRLLARRLAALGETFLAIEVASEGLAWFPGDVALSHALALALARSGATTEARALMAALGPEAERSGEARALLARTYKDWWAATGEREALDQARALYAASYACDGTYFAGINAASMALLAGATEEAHRIAREILPLCEAASAKAGAEPDAERYWSRATAAEAHLILGEWETASRLYGEACEVGQGAWANLLSTRRQAQLLLKHLGLGPERLDACFRLPSVAVFAGHLIDRPDRARPRFPSDQAAAVGRAIARWLEAQRVGVAYGSLGCGADILFAEAVLARGAEFHAVLPVPRDAFVRGSVAVGGLGWVERFETVLAGAAAVHETREPRGRSDAVLYDFANRVMAGLARQRALEWDVPLAALAVWDGQPGDGRGGTADAVTVFCEVAGDVAVIRPLAEEGELTATQLPRAEADSERDPGWPEEQFGDGTRERVGVIVAAVLPEACLAGEGGGAEQATALRETWTAAGAPVAAQTWETGVIFVFDRAASAVACARRIQRLGRTDPWKVGMHAGPVLWMRWGAAGEAGEMALGCHVRKAAAIARLQPAGAVHVSRDAAAMIVGEMGRAAPPLVFQGRRPVPGGAAEPIHAMRKTDEGRG